MVAPLRLATLVLSVSFAPWIAPRVCLGQTVIRDSAPPSPPPATVSQPSGMGQTRLDSLRSRGDTFPPSGAARPAASPPAPSPPQAQAAPKPTVPAGPPLPQGVCPPGSDPVSTDVLLVTFRSRTTPAEQDATIKAAKGTIVAPDPTDPGSAYVRFPTDGNEFALRVAADRLIRAPAVKEVDAVECPAAQ